ncbi:hypothetical protein EMCLV025L [Equine molluscum contagiosum-like virus]|nr:hypothetical protein EMCLV025L [Equine molluscum contagiosum-like virus]
MRDRERRVRRLFSYLKDAMLLAMPSPEELRLVEMLIAAQDIERLLLLFRRELQLVAELRELVGHVQRMMLIEARLDDDAEEDPAPQGAERAPGA